MAFQHRENSGALFRNDHKTSDAQPDYKGTINVAGSVLDIAGWIKKTTNGEKSFLSLKVSVPRERAEVE